MVRAAEPIAGLKLQQPRLSTLLVEHHIGRAGWRDVHRGLRIGIDCQQRSGDQRHGSCAYGSGENSISQVSCFLSPTSYALGRWLGQRACRLRKPQSRNGMVNTEAAEIRQFAAKVRSW